MKQTPTQSSAPQTVAGSFAQIPDDVLNDTLVWLSREDIRNNAKYALLAISAIGLVGFSLAAPNLPKLFAPLFRHKKRITIKAQKQELAKSFYYLKRYGYIKMEHTTGGVIAKLTALGKKRSSKLKSEITSITRPPRWDGKWWLVAADIPTKSHRFFADALRDKLKRLGFVALQRSLWVYPYCPTVELNIILTNYHLSHFVTIMEISNMDKQDSKRLKEHFIKTGEI